jgi:hypothetical protein
MPAQLRLVDQRTVSVSEDVATVLEILKAQPSEFYEFRAGPSTVRRIRLSAIIEVEKGHTK